MNFQGLGAAAAHRLERLSGTTNISGGTLELGGAGLLSSGTASAIVANYSAAIANSGVLAVDTSVSQTFSGVISGTGYLQQLGPGTLTLATGKKPLFAAPR